MTTRVRSRRQSPPREFLGVKLPAALKARLTLRARQEAGEGRVNLSATTAQLLDYALEHMPKGWTP